MMMKIQELAAKVAEELTNPEKWSRYSMARDAEYRRVWFNDSRAARWCVYGHALRLGGSLGARFLAHAYHSRFGDDIMSDNDLIHRGREYVRARLLELANS
jgi:hypothetical protein